MRKISYIIIALVGTIGKASAVSDETLIRQLVEEKNQKLATLEQCTKKVTGFKVAGISTLGLTAVGVAGNIALKNKNKEMDGQIAFAKNELARQQERTKDSKTLAERQADCEKHSDIAKWNGERCVCRDEKKLYDDADGTCLSFTNRIAEFYTRCDEFVAPLMNQLHTEADNTYNQLLQDPKHICKMCDADCLVLRGTKYLEIYHDFCKSVNGKWDYLGKNFTIKTSLLYEAANSGGLEDLVNEYNLNSTEINQPRQALINCVQSKALFFKVSCKCN
jgi:hypothetical protein